MSATPQENNAAPAPQKTKKSIWKWLAIGCLGIIVLTIGGCAILVKLGFANVTVNGETWGAEKKGSPEPVQEP